MLKSIFLVGFVISLSICPIFSQNCISINQQPENQLTVENDDIILSVNATSSENLSYQWQVFDSDINDWVDLINNIDYNGSDTDRLTITNVLPTINNTRFRVLISGQSISCTIESDEAVITYVIITVNNLFTPNGDGFNEFFKINGLGRFPNSKLQIYNRWGNLIHEKINYQNDWDGIATTGFSINGSKKIPTGTYFYTIDLKFDNKKLSGWLYINR